MRRQKQLTMRQPKMVSCHADVIAGPETAARLGVPVGTIVETREVRKYRNPLRQLWWQLTHPGVGRITIERGVS